MRTSIFSPGSMCQSVKFGSLTLRNTNYAILGENLIVQKIRIEPIMLNFFAKTENLKNRRSKYPIYNRGKVLKKAAGKCYSQFPDTKEPRVEPSYHEIGGGVITEGEYNYSS